MRIVLQALQGEAVRPRAERVAVRPEPQHHVEAALVAGPAASIAVSSSTERPATGESGSSVSLVSVVAIT